MTRASRHVEAPNPAAACCHGKAGFATFTEADNATARKRGVMAARGKDIPALSVYRCPKCRQWHIAGAA